MYVSITGLKPKGLIGKIRFWRHAVPSFNQAKKAAGLLFSDVKAVDGYQHTLTAWEDRKDMMAYLRTGAHKKAMKIFPQIATGATIGYEADKVPSWEEALEYWRKNAVSYDEKRLSQQ